MILLYYKDEIVGAQIRKPDIKPQVIKLFSKTYKPAMAKRYAESVSTFFEENIKFPEEGIYRLDDEGKLSRFNLKEGCWDKGKTAKREYVISCDNAFWEKFSQRFPYLKSFMIKLQNIIEATTEKMFEATPAKCHSISVQKNNQFLLNSAANYPVENVFKEYCTEEASKQIMWQLYHEVFNTGDTEELPLVIILDNVAKFALTTSDVYSKIEMGRIDSFLKRFFAPEDIKGFDIRLKNAVLYGMDSDFDIYGMSERGLVIKFSGIQVLIIENELRVLDTPENRSIINKLKPEFWCKEFARYCVEEGIYNAHIWVNNGWPQEHEPEIDIFKSTT